MDDLVSKNLRATWGVSAEILNMWVVRDYGLRFDEIQALVGLRFGRAPSNGAERTHYFTRVKVFLPAITGRRALRRARTYDDILIAYLWNADPIKRPK